MIVLDDQKLIRRFPSKITYIAPLTTFAFCEALLTPMAIEVLCQPGKSWPEPDSAHLAQIAAGLARA